jgi:hypothetical protein
VSARFWLIYGWGRPDTVAAYLEIWTSRHPRLERTSAKYEQRINRVLDVTVDGRPLADWRLRDLRRRHALALVDHLLVEQGRTLGGVVTILRSLSAMAEDAITDDLAEINPFNGIKLGRNECSRSFEQIMHSTQLIGPVVRSPRTSLHQLAARSWLHPGYFGDLFGSVMR